MMTMSRMIQKEASGRWQAKGIPWEDLREGGGITKETYQILYGCLCKLKDYEDSGLNPDQVRDMQGEVEDLAEHICDGLCRYRQETAGQEELDAVCRKCPLTACMRRILGITIVHDIPETTL